MTFSSHFLLYCLTLEDFTGTFDVEVQCLLGGLGSVLLSDSVSLLGGGYFTERNRTERNSGLFHGTDKCGHGAIILILVYLIHGTDS